MAQDANTVTPPNPTPPTNMSFVGATIPDVPNFTKTQYANPFNLTADKSGANGSTLYLDARPQSPYGVNPNPPPYADDGSAGSLTAIAAKTAAPASGTGATSGGTENSYPGTGSNYANPNNVGAVPASASADGEGRTTESVFTASVPNPSPNGQLQTVSVLGNYVGLGGNNSNGVSAPSPNMQHASSLSPATNPALNPPHSPATQASGGGTFSLTVNGTNFTKQSVIYMNGIAQVTTFVSSTQLTAATCLKRPTAGTYPLKVVTGGVVETATANYTFT